MNGFQFSAEADVFPWVGWVCSKPWAAPQAPEGGAVTQDEHRTGVGAGFSPSAPSSVPGYVGAGGNASPRESLRLCAGVWGWSLLFPSPYRAFLPSPSAFCWVGWGRTERLAEGEASRRTRSACRPGPCTTGPLGSLPLLVSS